MYKEILYCISHLKFDNFIAYLWASQKPHHLWKNCCTSHRLDFWITPIDNIKSIIFLVIPLTQGAFENLPFLNIACVFPLFGQVLKTTTKFDSVFDVLSTKSHCQYLVENLLRWWLHRHLSRKAFTPFEMPHIKRMEENMRLFILPINFAPKSSIWLLV